MAWSWCTVVAMIAKKSWLEIDISHFRLIFIVISVKIAFGRTASADAASAETAAAAAAATTNPFFCFVYLSCLPLAPVRFRSQLKYYFFLM